MALSRHEREQFLAEPHVAALVVSAGQNRGPLTLPPVTRTTPGTDAMLWELSRRYLPPEKVPPYIEFAKAELGEQVAIYLRPQRWLSADLGAS